MAGVDVVVEPVLLRVSLISRIPRLSMLLPVLDDVVLDAGGLIMPLGNA